MQCVLFKNLQSRSFLVGYIKFHFWNILLKKYLFSSYLSDTHKIVIPSYAMENMPGIVKTGERLLITGKLRTKHFEQDNGKRGTSIHIIAKQIYLCDNYKSDEGNKIPQNNHADLNEANKLNKTQFPCDVANFEIKDQNHIEIMAQICFDILNYDSHSTFNLALHYITM